MAITTTEGVMIDSASKPGTSVSTDIPISSSSPSLLNNGTEEAAAVEKTLDEKRYEADGQAHLPHIEGVRLWILVFVLSLGLLMASLETTIIGTALISIGSELGDYSRSSWVVAAYLITYTGFLIIFARFSDLFGRRTAFLTALFFFTAFSLACGLAQTMDQLIVFRALQGIGGGGLYSLAMGIATEVPGEVRGAINGILASTFAISSAIGPLVGGGIASHASWRWVFLINVPVGAVLFVLALWQFPKNGVRLNIGMPTFKRVDYPGIVLSLVAIVCLEFALQQGGNVLAWKSPAIIATLVIQGVCWVAFVVWEVYLTKRASKTSMLPVWPARLFAGRVIGSAMLTSFLSGLPFMTIIIYLPQRFQLESDLSPVAAGVRMLAYLLVSSFTAGVASVIYVLKNVLFPFIVVATGLQVIGLGLMSTLKANGGVPPEQYGYQVILGLGFGISLSSLPLIGRLQVGPEDHAVNMGAITQIRILGGLVGIGIGEVILSSRVWSTLGEILSPAEIKLLLANVANVKNFTPAQQAAIRASYGAAFNLQFRIMMYITIVCFVISLGCWVKDPIEVRDMEKIETARRDAKVAEALREKRIKEGGEVGGEGLGRGEKGEVVATTKGDDDGSSSDEVTTSEKVTTKGM